MPENTVLTSPFSRLLLKEVVIQHLYLNYVRPAEFNCIASKLEIPMKTQRLAQGKEKPKRLGR